MRGAIFSYNHSQAYVESVMLRAKLLGGTPDQLLGASAGDKRTVSVDFPADFVTPQLAGKKGVYEVEVVEVKEVKFRPMIDDHDYDVKMRSMQRFFEEGDKVKVTLRFRGREMAHQELGARLLERVKGDTEKIAKVEMDARFEGRQMIMVLAPR